MYVKARKARLAAGIAAVALVAAACGGGAGDENGGDAASQATSAPATTAAPPTTAAPTTTAPPATTAPALPTDAMGLLIAALENSAEPSVRGDMRLDMGELASVGLEFETDGNQNFSMTMRFAEMTGPDGEGPGVEIQSVDGIVYLQFVVPEGMQGLVGAAMPEGWFTLDAAAAAEMGIVCPSPVPGGASVGGLCPVPNDNTYMIEHVTGAEMVGPDDLDGLAVSHIRFTVDAAALAAEASASFGDGDGAGDALPFGSGAFGGGDFGLDELVFDIWIDTDGLIRRMSLDLGAAMEELMGDLDETESGSFGQELAGLFDITNVLNFYDYGADITIEAPPAGEIVGDFGDMMGAGFGAG